MSGRGAPAAPKGSALSYGLRVAPARSLMRRAMAIMD